MLAFVSISDVRAATLTLGTINHAPVREIRQFSPFAAHLVQRLGMPELQQGRVVIADTITHMAELLKSGQVDLYIDSPLPSLAVNHLSGAQMLLRRWKHDIAEYAAVFFVKSDSPIRSLADLSGQVIGFKDPFSSSGYLLPRIALTEAGLTSVPVANQKRPLVESGQVGYLFTQGNENTIVWVLYGKVDAGAIGQDEFVIKAKSERDRLRVIHTTTPIPRHVVSFRADMSEELKSRLLELLTSMDRNELDRRILEKFENTTRFDAIPVGLERQLEQMRPTVLNILGIP
ncbi:MAG: phosphate/phosphite/phosphonate ABC transporter substrate-binding protein [Magnetococcales bacterium]|nr:phosphate/phosphite/phosphonate ABC transporter substrate-binding protein [Magnetococcales bacterium]